MGELPTTDHPGHPGALGDSIDPRRDRRGSRRLRMDAPADSPRRVQQKETPASTAPAAPRRRCESPRRCPTARVHAPTDATPPPARECAGTTHGASRSLLPHGGRSRGTHWCGAASVGEQTIVIAFRKSAWTDVRDRDGRVLLNGPRQAAARRRCRHAAVRVKIGNAGDVRSSTRAAGRPRAVHAEKRRTIDIADTAAEDR